MLKKLVKAAVVVEKLSKDAPGAPIGGGWTVEKFASEKPSDHFARELKARRERNLGEEAADKLRQSLAVRVRAFGRQNAEVAETLNNIGEAPLHASPSIFFFIAYPYLSPSLTCALS
jgi:hypothetical protein